MEGLGRWVSAWINLEIFFALGVGLISRQVRYNCQSR